MIDTLGRAYGWYLALLLALNCGQLPAQLALNTIGTTYTIDFSTPVSGVVGGPWDGSGFSPTPVGGQLNSNAWAVSGWSDGDLSFGGIQATPNTDYTRQGSTGFVSTGGLYSFSGTNITGVALGIQPGVNDWAPGTLTLRMQNNASATITALDVDYDLFYHNDQPSSTRLLLSWSVDNITYVPVPSYTFITPAAAAAGSWVPTPLSGNITGFNVPAGSFLYLRWTGIDEMVAGARDEFALDDIQITPRASTRVRFAAGSAVVNEMAGTFGLVVKILNPSAVQATTVSVVLSSGSAAYVGNYSTQTVTFPPNSVVDQTVTLTITNDAVYDGSDTVHFALQNVIGGMGSPAIASPSSHTLTITEDELCTINIRAMLEGPYYIGHGLMKDDLRSAGYVPLTEPYTTLGYTQVNGGGGESTTASVMNVTGANAVVDWVFVELRSPTTPSVVLATHAALIQRDGDVVDMDGFSPVRFQVNGLSYYIALRHRNHLGVMTQQAITLDQGTADLDLTDPLTLTYGIAAMKSVDGMMMLWAGDVTRNGQIKYNGVNNDRDPILSDIGGTVLTQTVSGYRSTDVNLSGVVKYNGAANDRDVILQNIGGTVLSATRTQQLP